MAKIIEGIPEYISREQYLDLFRAVGVTPDQVFELRFGSDGIHALVVHQDEHGHEVLDKQNPDAGPLTHRVFIPVRD